MKDILLSVIVPVYNCELYLVKCIESILNQSFKNLEIILVDDGSSDSSGQICDEYAKKYNHIVCIHKENEGACYARRDGILIAKGEYVGFVDSDDWVDASMYEILMQNVLDNKVDIITSGFLFESGDILIDLIPEGIYRDNDCNVIYKEMIYEPEQLRSGMLCSVCTKVYRKSLLEKYLRQVPPNVRVWEDLTYVYLPFLETRNIQITHKVFYHYEQHSDSTSHRYDIDLFNKTVYAFKTAEWLHSKCEETIVIQLKQLCLHCLVVLLKNELSKRPKNLSFKDYVLHIREEGENEYFIMLYHEIQERELYMLNDDVWLCSCMDNGYWLWLMFCIRGEIKWRKMKIRIMKTLSCLKKICRKII